MTQKSTSQRMAEAMERKRRQWDRERKTAADAAAADAAATAAATSQSAESKGGPKLPAALMAKPLSDSGEPGGGQGRVDVTGTMPDGIRVDPDLTEGHPGYDESGDSEVIPPQKGAS